MEFNHISVLLNECIEGLNINPNGIYVDGTAGGGGHSAEILKKLDCGKLISIDRDPDAITTISERFKNEPNSIIVNGCFGDMKKLLNDRGVYQVDGVLLDIGVSSHQLDTDERGFSFHKDAPLDMRMSQSGTSAEDLVNDLSYEELRDIIYRYGEDKFAPSIAKGIVKAREEERRFYLSESGFDSREKEFFRLRVYEEKTLFETAEIMGYSPRTIDRINRKVKKKIVKVAPMYYRGFSLYHGENMAK